jgi:hypothetical protein
MSRNIFSVLETNDSDDESKVKKSEPLARLTKKQQRAEDQVKREHFGDKVVKDVNAIEKLKDPIKEKGDYKPGEPRPFERRSGNERQAFGIEPKKGGFGKGNVGGVHEIQEELALVDGAIELESSKKKVEEPVIEVAEEIITLDEYVTMSGFNTDFLNKKDDAVPINIKSVDPNVKVIKPKEKEVNNYNKKNTRHSDEILLGNNKNGGIDFSANSKKTKMPITKKVAKIEFNEENFPSLS